MSISVSFCLKSYNQRQYIGSALRAALLQGYDPLEIIVVDDCSNDGSDEVIRQLIDAYREGKGCHPVKYIRHASNLGVIKTFESGVYAASGDLIIEADGDDISLPWRVRQTVAHWERHQCKPMVMFCNGYNFSSQTIGEE